MDTIIGRSRVFVNMMSCMGNESSGVVLGEDGLNRVATSVWSSMNSAGSRIASLVNMISCLGNETSGVIFVEEVFRRLASNSVWSSTESAGQLDCWSS